MKAIASQALCSCSKEDPDVNKIDLMIKRTGLIYPVQFQVKSEADPASTDTHIQYDLEASTFNALTEFNYELPGFLALMAYPAFGDPWVNVDNESQTSVKRVVYWMYLGNEERTTNTNRKRIFIPRSNILTPQWITGLFDALRDSSLEDYLT